MRKSLVDSCGWAEYFTDATNAGFFAPAIEDVESLIVPTICILEVAKVVSKKLGDQAAAVATSAMCRGSVVDLDTDIAIMAADLGVRYKLPLADSVIYATARVHDATVWTQDRHFTGLDQVKYVEKG